MNQIDIDLAIALDFGGSMTKVVAQSPKKPLIALAIEPEVIEVAKGSLIESQELGMAAPKDRAWVGLDDHYYAVGYLAQYQFLANPGLSQLKAEKAIYKSLAAIWVVAQQLQLPQKLKLALCCVLPPGEYKDHQHFEQALHSACSNFITPSGVMEVDLVHFNCKPEGAGIFIMHRAKKGEKAIQKTVTAVLMLGYRNASVVLSNRGNVGGFQTSELGFVQLVKGVVQRTSGQSLERLTPALAKAGTDLVDAPLKLILRSSSPEQQQTELEQLKSAISLSRQEYSTSIRSWLKEILPPSVEEIVLCGGTADYLQSELRQQLGSKKLYWHADVELPSEIAALQMGNRFGDVWCLWNYFAERVMPPQRKRRSRQLTKVQS